MYKEDRIPELITFSDDQSLVATILEGYVEGRNSEYPDWIDIGLSFLCIFEDISRKS